MGFASGERWPGRRWSLVCRRWDNHHPITRAQESGEDGEDSARTKKNLMDSLEPKQRIKQMDRQKDRETDSQTDWFILSMGRIIVLISLDILPLRTFTCNMPRCSPCRATLGGLVEHLGLEATRQGPRLEKPGSKWHSYLYMKVYYRPAVESCSKH